MVKDGQGITFEYNWRGFLPTIIILAIGSVLVYLSGSYAGDLGIRLLFFGFMFLFVGFISLFALALTILSKYYAVNVLNAKIEEEMRKNLESEIVKEEEERKEDILDEIL